MIRWGRDYYGHRSARKVSYASLLTYVALSLILAVVIGFVAFSFWLLSIASMAL